MRTPTFAALALATLALGAGCDPAEKLPESPTMLASTTSLDFSAPPAGGPSSFLNALTYALILSWSVGLYTREPEIDCVFCSPKRPPMTPLLA